MHLKLSVKRFYHNTLFRLLRTFFGDITFAKLNILFRREGERGVSVGMGGGGGVMGRVIGVGGI